MLLPPHQACAVLHCVQMLCACSVASLAVRLTLDWAEASTEVREFLEALATADK